MMMRLLTPLMPSERDKREGVPNWARSLHKALKGASFEVFRGLANCLWLAFPILVT